MNDYVLKETLHSRDPIKKVFDVEKTIKRRNVNLDSKFDGIMIVVRTMKIMLNRCIPEALEIPM